MSAELTLTLRETDDVAESTIRVDLVDLHLIGISPGNLVAITSNKCTQYAKATPAFMEDRNQGIIKVSRQMRLNLEIKEGELVRIMPPQKKIEMAEHVNLSVKTKEDFLYLKARISVLNRLWRDKIITSGDKLVFPTMDRFPLEVTIKDTKPSSPIQIVSATTFSVENGITNPLSLDIAGLRETYLTCHRLTSKRLHNDISAQAKSILLTGPTGCGKALLVHRLAEDLNAHLRVLDINQLLDRQTQNGTLEMEGFFSEVAARIPLILLLDNIHALSNHPASHAVITQLCTLLDELRLHRGIILFGICSGIIDERFTTGQRFDLSLYIDAPDMMERMEMLLLALHNIPISPNVDVQQIAKLTRSFTASDIQRLVTTASLSSAAPILIQEDFTTALRNVTPKNNNHLFCDTPEIPWDDIAGIDDIKNMLLDTISCALQHEAQFIETHIRSPRAILISGGHGTGKSSLVRALANAIPLNFIEINCQTLITRNQEATSSAITESFALARRKAPCLIFFDDVDCVFGESSSLSGGEPNAPRPIVAQLLAEIDSLHKMHGVIVVAATSRPDRLTSEMTSSNRFDFAVSLPLPDESVRKKILQIHTRRLPIAADVDFDSLASMTNAMTPSDIANLCNRAGLFALQQAFTTDGVVIPAVVTGKLFEHALRGYKS